MKTGLPLVVGLLLTLLNLAADAAGDSPQSLYNQGNGHARAREWGLAVVDYQRARLQAPNDPDIDANLQYVLAAAKVKSAPLTLVERLTRWTSPNIAAALGLLGLVMAGCSLIWLRPLPRIAVWLLGVPLMAFAVGHAVGLAPLLYGAVVVGGSAAVQASPVPMADTLVSLPEATPVTIVAERPDYVLVTAPATGMTGWVQRAHLVAVVPPAR